jgi:transposase
VTHAQHRDQEHEAVFKTLVGEGDRMEAPGVSTGTIADMLVVLGDNP